MERVKGFRGRAAGAGRGGFWCCGWGLGQFEICGAFIHQEVVYSKAAKRARAISWVLGGRCKPASRGNFSNFDFQCLLECLILIFQAMNDG